MKIDKEVAKGLMTDHSQGMDVFMAQIEHDFCRLSVKLYFSLLSKYKVKEEFVLHLTTSDAYSNMSRRSFSIEHPDLGQIIFSLLHRVDDWFDLIIGKPEKEPTESNIVGITLLFATTFWEVNGIAQYKENIFHLMCRNGFDNRLKYEGSLNDVARIIMLNKFQNEILEHLLFQLGGLNRTDI